MSSPNKINGASELAVDLETPMKKLIVGVAATAATTAIDAPIPFLQGSDGGLYARLCRVATSLGEVVADDDAETGDILTRGKRGLRRQMASGMTNFVKQGSPAEMAATLAHEQGHRYTAPVYDLRGLFLSETIADGTAFVVCDANGLDISVRSFPYLAGYTEGAFTDEMIEGIHEAATDIMQLLDQQR